MNKSFLVVGLTTAALFAGCGAPKLAGETGDEKGAAPSIDSLPEAERPFVGRWRVDMSRIAAQAAEAAKSGRGGYGEAMAYLPSIMADVRADHTVLLSGVNHVGTGTWVAAGETMTFGGSRVLNGLVFTRSGGVPKMNIERAGPGRPAERFEMVRVERGD